MVFDKPQTYKAYDYKRATAYAERIAESGTKVFEFKKLEKGPYAIVVHHDQDGDYEFDMRGNIPLEGYVTSGAQTKFDEPTFSQASVEAGLVELNLFYYDD
jgi:uncharacterized protein (DUF2141 family)